MMDEVAVGQEGVCAKCNIRLGFCGVPPSSVLLCCHKQPFLHQAPIIPVVQGGIRTFQMMFYGIEELVRHHRPIELVIQASRPKRKSNHPWDV